MSSRPKVDEFGRVKFYFIEDLEIREGVAETFFYILWLSRQHEKVSANIKSLVTRDIAIHFGMLVETLLYYAINVYKKKKIYDGFYFSMHDKEFWCKSESKMLKEHKHPTGANLFIGTFYKKRKKIKFSEKTTFHDLINIATKLEILDVEQSNIAHKIREERNCMHDKVIYTKDDATEFMKDTKVVKDAVKDALDNLA